MDGITSASLIAIVAAVAGIGIAVFFLKGRRVVEADADWFSGFAPERYRPMLRLIDRAEMEWVAGQAGSSPELIRQVRRTRARLFRLYLRSMRTDFTRLQALGRVLIGTGQASPALAQALFQANWAFTRAYWQVQFRLALFQMGARTVDASRLLEPLSHLNQALRAPLALGSAA